MGAQGEAVGALLVYAVCFASRVCYSDVLLWCCDAVMLDTLLQATCAVCPVCPVCCLLCATISHYVCYVRCILCAVCCVPCVRCAVYSHCPLQQLLHLCAAAACFADVYYENKHSVRTRHSLYWLQLVCRRPIFGAITTEEVVSDQRWPIRA
jgi:hypothetical protein